MSDQISPDLAPSLLEQRAVDQRRRLHNSVSELRSQVKETVREKLDVKRYAREYVWPASAAVALIGFVLGYGTGGTVKHMIR
jgi:hypothetical protein